MAARTANSSPPSVRSFTSWPLTKKLGVWCAPAAWALSMSRLIAARVSGVATQASISARVRPLAAMAGAYQSSRSPPRSTAACPSIRMEVTSKNRSGAAQRASDAAGSDICSGWVGRLRKTKRTWPVSTSRCLNTGQTSWCQFAQAGQAKEAYSITVTGASARPMTRSPAVTGATCSTAVAGAAASGASRASAAISRKRRTAAMSALLGQLGVDRLGQVLEAGARGGAGGDHLGAVDEEGRRAGDPGLRGGASAFVGGLQAFRIPDAVLDLLVREPGAVADPEQGVARVHARAPFGLALHDGVDHVEVFVLAGAAGDHEAGHGDVGRRRRQFAENIPHLIGVDVPRLEL